MPRSEEMPKGYGVTWGQMPDGSYRIPPRKARRVPNAPKPDPVVLVGRRLVTDEDKPPRSAVWFLRKALKAYADRNVACETSNDADRPHMTYALAECPADQWRPEPWLAATYAVRFRTADGRRACSIWENDSFSFCMTEDAIRHSADGMKKLL